MQLPTTSVTPAPETASTGRTVTLRSCYILLALLVVLLAAVEIGARVLLTRVSRIEGRVAREYNGLFAPLPTSKPSVVLLGNSLLEAAVQPNAIRAALSDRMEVRRFAVEQTAYIDWHYGIRRLLAEGVHPNVFLLMLDAPQLRSDSFRGEYSAFRLVSNADVLDLCGTLNLHPTNAANMIFSRFSMFFAMRSELRKVLLGRIMPDVPMLTRLMAPQRPPAVPDAELRAVIRRRMGVLRQLADAHGVRIMLLIPPAVRMDDVPSIVEASREAGVETILPFAPGAFRPEDFSDGYHTTDHGAEKYTKLLADKLAALPRI